MVRRLRGAGGDLPRRTGGGGHPGGARGPEDLQHVAGGGRQPHDRARARHRRADGAAGDPRAARAAPARVPRRREPALGQQLRPRGTRRGAAPRGDPLRTLHAGRAHPDRRGPGDAPGERGGGGVGGGPPRHHRARRVGVVRREPAPPARHDALGAGRGDRECPDGALARRAHPGRHRAAGGAPRPARRARGARPAPGARALGPGLRPRRPRGGPAGGGLPRLLLPDQRRAGGVAHHRAPPRRRRDQDRGAGADPARRARAHAAGPGGHRGGE